MSPITPQLFEFLSDLSVNNRRDWFKANKGRYDSDVLDPSVELVSQLVQPLAKLAPMLLAAPKRHGGSVMRIYKDTRFSRDKTPYKTAVGISFRHEADGTIHAPGVYLHLDPRASFLGVGCWRPQRSALVAIRSAIEEHPAGWKRCVTNKRFRQHFELAGDSLQTAPRGIPRDHPQIQDLRRIDFIGTAPLEISEICAPDFVDQLKTQVKAAKPFMTFLCDALNVPY
ncbi:MAG TPA: TIGR02453 family protein [Rhodopirellula sp.]|nr:TIGR02453 family protein [Rhodopirellula sp.]